MVKHLYYLWTTTASEWNILLFLFSLSVISIGRAVVMEAVKHSGLYNLSKDYILVTLYNFNVWQKHSSLTLINIQVATGLAYDCLTKRLPVFSGKRRYPLSGKLWNERRLLLHRKAIEVNKRPVFAYYLSAYGRRRVEDMPRDRFWSIVQSLKPRWEKLSLQT